MIYLGNLGGSLNIATRPLIDFKFENDKLVSCKVLSTYGLPYEFVSGNCDENMLRCFFNARIVPKERFKLSEDLRAAGIEFYIPERIIRYQNGKSIIDQYWLSPDTDDTCWREGYVESLCNIIGRQEIYI